MGPETESEMDAFITYRLPEWPRPFRFSDLTSRRRRRRRNHRTIGSDFLLLCFMFVRACLELPQLLILNETRGRSPTNTSLPQHARKTCVHHIVCFYDPRIKSEVKSQGVVLGPSSFKKHRESDRTRLWKMLRNGSMPLFSHAYINVMSSIQVEKKNWWAATRPNLSGSDFNRKIYSSISVFVLATCSTELKGFFKL